MGKKTGLKSNLTKMVMVLAGVLSALVWTPARAQAACVAANMPYIYVLKEGAETVEKQTDIHNVRNYLNLADNYMLGIREINGEPQILLINLEDSRFDTVIPAEDAENFGISIRETESGWELMPVTEETADAA